jgi:hypothetical protein
MPPNSQLAYAVARRLLASPDGPTEARGSEGAAADPVAAVERAIEALSRELSRWFGPFGYHALLTRALTDARADSPSLATLRVHSALDPRLLGLREAAQTHGADVALEGVATLLAALITLLGRLIGEDLAVNLVSNAMTNSTGDAGPDVDPGTTSASDGEGGR